MNVNPLIAPYNNHVPVQINQHRFIGTQPLLELSGAVTNY